ncbi:Ankyrin repeat protein [Aspergillus sclerotialis]|uniref:Ankyrin repeat protein n=1 Tax=Aspergillus sclerotialis TaxID=2070753 RepID=A0A3A2ZTJ8_9EURO|nr:Ankyrin repeat protein [Aspergillus sclerotialis]
MKLARTLNPKHLFRHPKRADQARVVQPSPTVIVDGGSGGEKHKTPQTSSQEKPNKTTAFFNAVQKNQPDQLSSLLNSVDINTQDTQGNTALHIAIRNRSYECIDKLLKRTCNVNTKNAAGETPFQLALSLGWPDLLKKLLDRGAEDVTGVNEKGETALHMLSAYSENIIRVFLENGVDPNVQDNEGNTVLHLVAKRRDAVSVFKILLEFGVDVGVLNHEGRNALHVAAFHNNAKLVLLLKERGLDINTTDHEGNTALHLAAARRSDEVVRYLLELEEIQIYARNRDGMTPLEKALSGNSRVRQVKGSRRPDSENAITVHAGVGDPVLLRLLLKAGVDVDAKDPEGRSAFHTAILENDKKSLQILLDHGGDVTVENRNGHTPAKLAAMRGKYDMVTMLVRYGSRHPPRVLKVYDPAVFEGLMEWEVLNWE